LFHAHGKERHTLQLLDRLLVLPTGHGRQQAVGEALDREQILPLGTLERVGSREFGQRVNVGVAVEQSGQTQIGVVLGKEAYVIIKVTLLIFNDYLLLFFMFFVFVIIHEL